MPGTGLRSGRPEAGPGWPGMTKWGLMAHGLCRRGGAQRIHRKWWRECPRDVADLGLLHAVCRHLHLIDRIGAVVGGEVFLKAHGARTDVGFRGVDAGGTSEAGVDVGDDAGRVGTTLGERGDALNELDRLAEQSLFVSPWARRRAEHQRGGKQVSPEIHVSAPSLPAKSPSRKILARAWLTQS